MTQIENEVLQTLLEDTLAVWQQVGMDIINQKFGINAGFDERRNHASVCARMQQEIDILFSEDED